MVRNARDLRPGGLLRGGRPDPAEISRRLWRSPIRGPWLTAVLGLTLLVGLTIVILTGLASYAAYDPRLPGNDTTPGHGILGFYLFDWPTHPVWLYRLTQGLHVTLGLVLVPVVLGKLWSVIPRLFAWPPVRSLTQLVERISLLGLVGGVVFEMATGILNIQYWYVFPGSFYTLHLYGAWVFIASFVVHVGLKLPKMWRSLRARRLRDELRVDTAHTEPEPPDEDGLVPAYPARPSISRRGALGLVGAGSLTMLLVTVGQSIGGPLRRTALLAPRDTDPAPGDFQINRRAAEVGITQATVADEAWRLELRGGGVTTQLTRAQLAALPQQTVHLPIACVEGWSTGEMPWVGVRLSDLAALVGVHADALGEARVESIQRGGFGEVTLAANQVRDALTTLALHVNGRPLTLDHGYPARMIVPAAPGVHNTKWVQRITFLDRS